MKIHLKYVHPAHGWPALKRGGQVGRGPLEFGAELVQGGGGVHLGQVRQELLVDELDGASLSEKELHEVGKRQNPENLITS